MAQSRRLFVFIVLALVAVLAVVAVVLWPRSSQREAAPAAAPIPITSATSPLSTPAFAAEAPPTSSRPRLAVALLWIVLGGLLALGIAFLILRRDRSAQ
jgi:hypothetical protein